MLACSLIGWEIDSFPGINLFLVFCSTFANSAVMSLLTVHCKWEVGAEGGEGEY